MSGLPDRIANQVATHLDHIQDLLGGSDTIITLVARRPLADRGYGEGDIIMTRDELRKVIWALENREQMLNIALTDGSVKL